MTRCRARTVSVRGVAADVRGIVSLRIVGFRAHCGCGLLTRRYDNYSAARSAARRHNGISTGERPSDLDGSCGPLAKEEAS